VLAVLGDGTSAHRTRTGRGVTGLCRARAAVDPGLTGRALDEFATKDYLDTYSVMKPNLAIIQDSVAHIDHVAKLVGVDHVGIGSDWDGISSVPAGLEDVSRMPVLTAALLERGYSEKDVKKILGDNFLRVMRQVIGR
jgi:membrane dipeptidase